MRSILFNSFLLALVSSGYSELLPKHWHESGGWASNIEAGIGGKVIKVTNLNKSGSGSLTAALSASGPRLVVFEVGGVIDMEGDRININNGQLTIAGQTAPSPGITLIKGYCSITGKDIVISHIATRLGDKSGGTDDAVGITAENLVLDHFAASWSIDECLSMNGAKNITLYKTMVTEALSHATHPEGEHSKGSLIKKGTNNVSMIGTLYAHNALRNPRLHSGSQVAVINGVIYSWLPGHDDEGEKNFHFVIHMNDAKMSIVGNVAIQGPESVGEYLVSGHKSGKGVAYMKDNIIIDPGGKPLHQYADNVTPLDKPPLWPEAVEVMPPEESLYEVLRTVGPRPGDREAVTARTVKSVADGTGGRVDSQDDVGGYPDYAETRRPISVPDGLEARRAWLDSLEDEIAVDKKIDLSRLYKLVGSEESDKYRPSASTLPHVQTGVAELQIANTPSTPKQLRMRFTLPSPGSVGVTLFDLTGKAVAQRPGKWLPAGSHSLTVEVQHLKAGLYICRVRVGGTVVHRMVFL